MSCGEPHDVDCSEIIERVYLYLDHEMGDEASAYATIEEHLDECGPCFEKVDLERAIRTMVARSCGCEHAPDELKQRVLARIRQIRVQVTEY
ncbi:MAG TPA: mycothiol system anti-sigma-R factor [Jiangellaceae bacterium]|jgi:mycothiol system anti-sigma-R factor